MRVPTSGPNTLCYRQATFVPLDTAHFVSLIAASGSPRKPWSPHVLPRARPSPTAGRHRVGHVLRAREPRVPGTRRLRNVSQDTAPESPQAERSQGSPDPARHWVRSDTGHGRKRLLAPRLARCWTQTVARYHIFKGDGLYVRQGYVLTIRRADVIRRGNERLRLSRCARHTPRAVHRRHQPKSSALALIARGAEKLQVLNGERLLPSRKG